MRQSQVLICLLVASSIIMLVPSSNKVLADVIKCQVDVQCEGTDNDDVMKGTNQRDDMLGNGGDDKMTGGPGNDYLEGRQGSDQLDGGPGNDVMVGDDEDGNNAADAGADVINGGPGDDQLFQSQYIVSHGGDPLKSDGFQDELDCGPGNDEAWINVNTDHDTVKNCETVHTEDNP